MMKISVIMILMFASCFVYSENDQWKQELTKKLLKVIAEVDPHLDPKERATVAINKMTEIFSEEREKLAETLTREGYEAISVGSGALIANLVLVGTDQASSPLLTLLGAALSAYGCRMVFQNRPEAWPTRKQKIKETVIKNFRHFIK